VVDRELQLKEHRGQAEARHHLEHRARLETQTGVGPGLGRARARRSVPPHGRVSSRPIDLLVDGPARRPAAFDVNLRPPRDDRWQEAGKLHGPVSTVNSAITMTTCPAIAVPCGFDQYGRPVGLQLVGKAAR